MFRAFQHLVEACLPMLSLAIKLFTEQMLNDSTFTLLFSAFDQSMNICSVGACTVDDCCYRVQPCSAKCSIRLTTQQLLFSEMVSTFDRDLRLRSNI